MTATNVTNGHTLSVTGTKPVSVSVWNPDQNDSHNHLFSNSICTYFKVPIDVHIALPICLSFCPSDLHFCNPCVCVLNQLYILTFLLTYSNIFASKSTSISLLSFTYFLPCIGPYFSIFTYTYSPYSCVFIFQFLRVHICLFLESSS